MKHPMQRVSLRIAILCLLASPVAPLAGQAPAIPRRSAPIDLGVLEAPDRDQWQMPDRIMDALSIGDNSVVADVGAGAGWFTVRLSARVGPGGRVYAQDVQPEMLAAIERRVQGQGRRNVRTVLGTPTEPRLPSGAMDAILLVDAYHELADAPTLLRGLTTALKPGGRLAVIDFYPGHGGPGPAADERVAPAQVQADAARAGLTLERSEAFLRYQYLLIFRR
jgi:predicted methyltransferase